MTDEKSSTWNICIMAGGKEAKGTRPVSKAGLIALAEPEEKKKAFGLLRAKGNTEERKSSTWNIGKCFAGNRTKGPFPAAQAGLVSWAEPEEKKKPLVCCEPKGGPEKKRYAR